MDIIRDTGEMLDNLPGMLYQAVNGTPNFTFTFVSKGAMDLTGYSPEELENGIKFLELVHPDDVEIIERLYKQTIQVGLPLETIFRIKTKYGEEKKVWLSSKVTDTDDQGMPYVTEGFATDISKQIAMATASLANKAKFDFLAKMSQDIRTPMNEILGMAELGLRESSASKMREYTSTIKRAGKKLIHVLNNILDYSRIEGGDMEVFPEEYSLASLVNDVINTARPIVYKNKLGFNVNVDSNLPDILVGDSPRIRQIILNLLSNAAKFTDTGYVSLSISCDIDGDEARFNIMVEDTGRGIKGEDIESIFEPFTQFDTKVIEGTGLGLAIVKNLAQLMDGDIYASSIPSVGSIFSVNIAQKISPHSNSICHIEHDKKVLVFDCRAFCEAAVVRILDGLDVFYTSVTTLESFYDEIVSEQYSFVFTSNNTYTRIKKAYPNLSTDIEFVIVVEHGEKPSERAKEASIINMPVYCLPIADILNNKAGYHSDYSEGEASTVEIIAPTAKVLIVDDIRANLVVANGLLLPYKMEIDLCENAMEAIEAVKNNDYDLVLMDHMMPVMNGVEATIAIREMGKTMPIVALTANTAHGARELFSKSGFNDFMAKPIDLKRLDMIIEQWIPKEKQQRVVKTEEVVAKSAGLTIEGIDVAKGISRTGGSESIYIQVIDAYYENGKKLVTEIEDAKASGDIELFTIHVHALKSASASIGAQALSDMAAELEHAGENADIAFINDNTDVFLTELQVILGNMGKVLAEINVSETDEIRRHLRAFRDALTANDTKKVEELAKVLQEYMFDPNVGNDINKILKKKMLNKFEEAINLIELALMEVQ